MFLPILLNALTKMPDLEDLRKQVNTRFLDKKDMKGTCDLNALILETLDTMKRMNLNEQRQTLL